MAKRPTSKQPVTVGAAVVQFDRVVNEILSPLTPEQRMCALEVLRGQIIDEQRRIVREQIALHPLDLNLSALPPGSQLDALGRMARRLNVLREDLCMQLEADHGA